MVSTAKGGPTSHSVQIHEPGAVPRRVEVNGTLVVGRECEGLVVVDPKVSRRHFELRATEGSLTVTDLGSSNGTSVNGVEIDRETQLQPGDRVEAGDVVVQVLAPAGATVARRPGVDDLEAIASDAAVVRFRKGTVGERHAAAVARAARRARRTLSGFGSEPWGMQPQICLVDPFPDPGQPGQMVTEGTVVDAASGIVWMVVTAESPPEPLERPLALVFAASLPAAQAVAALVEGYGIHLPGAPDPAPQLRELDLPPLHTAEG